MTAKRKPMSRSKRFGIMKRDGFRCRLCGRSPVTTPGLVLEIDHKHPVSKGGTDNINNLQTVCLDCNRGKRDTVVAAGDAKDTITQFNKFIKTGNFTR